MDSFSWLQVKYFDLNSQTFYYFWKEPFSFIKKEEMPKASPGVWKINGNNTASPLLFGTQDKLKGLQRWDKSKISVFQLLWTLLNDCRGLDPPSPQVEQTKDFS